MKYFVIFFTIFSFFCCVAQAQQKRPTTFDKRETCEANKGIWRQFGNGCAGNCEAKFERFKVCTMAITFACDCGSDKCWDSDTQKCVLLENYEVVFDQKKAEEQKKLDEMKQARKTKSDEFRRQLVGNLVKNREGSQTPSSNQNSAPQNNLDEFYNTNDSVARDIRKTAIKINNELDQKQDQAKNIVSEVKNQAIEFQQNENKFEIPSAYLQKLQQRKDQEQKDSTAKEKATNEKQKDSTVKEKVTNEKQKESYKGFDEGLPQIPLPSN